MRKQFEPPIQKYQKIEEDHLNEEELEEVLNQGDQFENFDENSLKMLIHRLEQTIIMNQNQRIKFRGEPEKFVESEVELDENVREFLPLTAYPAYFPAFYHSSALSNLIQLLQHENDDIKLETLNFFKELVSADVEDDQVKTLLQLYNVLVKNLFLHAIVDVLENCDNKDIQLASLIILETMVEIQSSFSKVLCEQTKILNFLLKQIELGDNDVTLHCSEFLVDLIQGSPSNQQALMALNGMEIIIQILAQYRKKNVESANEKEIVSNFFDTISILLLSSDYQFSFTQLEGIQLMIKLLQMRNYTSFSAYKVILGAIEGNKENCKVFVDWNGLTFLFPILIQKGLKDKNPSKQKDIDGKTIISIIEECTLGILKNLIRHLETTYEDRVLTKFEEPLYTQRLIQLREYYNSNLKKKKQEGLSQEKQEEIYIQQLEKGLVLVESCDIILLELLRKNNEKVREIILKELDANQLTKEVLQTNILNMLKFFNSQAKEDFNHYHELTL